MTGYRLIERLTRELPRFKDELDTMKFICTDFWSSIYKKQINNLRTNHQGVYVLQDNAFRFLTRLSCGTQFLEYAPKVGTRLLELKVSYVLIIVTVCCLHLWPGARIGQSGHHRLRFRWCRRVSFTIDLVRKHAPLVLGPIEPSAAPQSSSPLLIIIDNYCQSEDQRNRRGNF